MRILHINKDNKMCAYVQLRDFAKLKQVYANATKATKVKSVNIKTPYFSQF